MSVNRKVDSDKDMPRSSTLCICGKREKEDGLTDKEERTSTDQPGGEMHTSTRAQKGVEASQDKSIGERRGSDHGEPRLSERE